MKGEIAIEDFEYSGIDELIKMNKHLFFYKKKAINDLTSVYNEKDEVLDFGAGLGAISELFYQRTNCRPDCLEIDKNLASELVKNGFKTFDNVEKIDKQYNMIYSLHVLEHIQDDEKSIEKIYSLIKPGGNFIIIVPAMPILYSQFDKEMGHFRRYSKKDLDSKLENAGFEIIKSNYQDFLGFFIGIIFKTLNYNKTDISVSDNSYKIYDRIFRLSILFDKIGGNKIAGKNLLVFARKR